MKKEIVLIGAGKIGKGYIADLFSAAGYHLIFMARSAEQVSMLRKQGYYTIFRNQEDGTGIDELTIDDFSIYCTQGEERQQCIDILSTATLASIQTYFDGFDDIANMLAATIQKRAQENNTAPLDVLLAVNHPDPVAYFHEAILCNLQTEKEIALLNEKVGLVATLTFRGGHALTPDMLAKDALGVNASDYPEFPVDEDGFRGEIPNIPGILPLDRMNERMSGKLWGQNVISAAQGVLGKLKGYECMQQVFDDAEIMEIALGAQQEGIYATLKRFNFTEEEFAKGARKQVEKKVKQPSTDTVNRQMLGLQRKLAKEERLVGPALACLQYGKTPQNLIISIAAAYLFYNEADEESVALRKLLQTKGIDSALRKVSSLSDAPLEAQLREMVIAEYKKIPTSI